MNFYKLMMNQWFGDGRYEYTGGKYPVSTFDESDTGTLVYDSNTLRATREKVVIC